LQEAEDPAPAGKWARTSSCVVQNKEAATKRYPVENWIWEGSWPEEYFEPGNMDLLPKRKKSLASLQEKDSEENTSCIRGDAIYAVKNPEYDKQLIIAGIYLDEVTNTISTACHAIPNYVCGCDPCCEWNSRHSSLLGRMAEAMGHALHCS
jgi:hypothetical protein